MEVPAGSTLKFNTNSSGHFYTPNHIGTIGFLYVFICFLGCQLSIHPSSAANSFYQWKLPFKKIYIGTTKSAPVESNQVTPSFGKVMVILLAKILGEDEDKKNSRWIRHNESSKQSKHQNEKWTENNVKAPDLLSVNEDEICFKLRKYFLAFWGSALRLYSISVMITLWKVQTVKLQFYSCN